MLSIPLVVVNADDHFSQVQRSLSLVVWALAKKPAEHFDILIAREELPQNAYSDINAIARLFFTNGIDRCICAYSVILVHIISSKPQ